MPTKNCARRAAKGAEYWTPRGRRSQSGPALQTLGNSPASVEGSLRGCRRGLHADQGPEAANLSRRDKKMQPTNLMWCTKQECWPLGSWRGERPSSAPPPPAAPQPPGCSREAEVVSDWCVWNDPPHMPSPTPFWEGGVGPALPPRGQPGMGSRPRSGALPSPQVWDVAGMGQQLSLPRVFPIPTLGGKLLASAIVAKI